ncbi:MAG TPA: lactonase family protein [Terriglobales bacterium]|nr:lactonase family protein [Terriglobales bacterium]
MRAMQRWFRLLLLTTILPMGTMTDATPAVKGKYLLFVGTYTDKESKGIYAYRFDPVSNQLLPLGVVAETTNPSFLITDRNARFLYAVNELQKYEGQASGGVSAFAIDQTSGRLSLLNEVPSRGADPCYLSFDKSGHYVLVANYTGGSVAVFPVSKDGSLGAPSAFVQHSGSGPNRERQEGPHAHWIETSPDNRFALAADLGLDEIVVYRFDAKNGSLIENDPPFAKLDPGVGPRHLSFHPNGKFAYVVNELKSTVTAFSYDANRGALQKLGSISTLPTDVSGPNDGAEIHVHPSGRFLFVSNRGHDSIAVFSIDPGSGELTLVQDVSTQGKTPRNFEIDPTGAFLFVANQNSGNIVVFRINPQTGKLTATGQVLSVPSPVSLRFVAAG